MKETKEISNINMALALEECQNGNHRAMFAPEFADARIEGKFWNDCFTTPSLMATGKTRQGNAVVVYAHVPNYFSNPENIRNAIKYGLKNGAGIMPEPEFQRLLGLEGEGVFVVDYKTLKKSSSGIIPVEKALEHPQTIPFLGGEDRAEKYLAKYKEEKDSSIEILHSDDLNEAPVGRLLGFGSCDSSLGLYGSSSLDNDGCFVRVRNDVVKSAEGDAKKIELYTPKQVQSLVKKALHKEGISGDLEKRILSVISK